MAAAGVAILDNPDLRGDALAHCVGVADDAHLRGRVFRIPRL